MCMEYIFQTTHTYTHILEALEIFTPEMACQSVSPFLYNNLLSNNDNS